MTSVTSEDTQVFKLMRECGQSPWLDFISRGILRSGRLKELIRGGLLGVTSNPSIFEKSITMSQSGYEKDIRRMLTAGKNTLEIYDALSISDIQKACDLFSEVYKTSNREHGYVSLEVLPHLAHDAEATVAEALRLYAAVARPNVMIKIPATPAGISAIRRVIAAGVNVNVTLIFSLKHYQAVAKAYREGLEDRLKAGLDLYKVHSVASVFVSRFDTYLDKQLDVLSASGRSGTAELYGKAAIANSKRIYQDFLSTLSDERFKKLQSKGASIQKVLWGSTSCKNPKYSDLIYVEPLIGRHTVNTMPETTLSAVLDHGRIEVATIEEGIREALETISQFKLLGCDLDDVGELLQQQGVKQFIESFEALMRSLENASNAYAKKKYSRLALAKVSIRIPDAELKNTYTGVLKSVSDNGWGKRFLQKDATLWKSDEHHQKVILNRLGWVRAHEWILGKLYEIDFLKEQIRKEKIKDIVLLGMGGSSLAPEVMSLICRRKPSYPRFRIIDSTDPASVLGVLKQVSLKSGLFIVASKSGSTIETSSQMKFFYDAVLKVYKQSKPSIDAGKHFIAITDPGSDLEKTASLWHFRKTFINPSDIGGRYSALSFFGIVPAVLMGLSTRDLLGGAGALLELLAKDASASNVTLQLGAFLGALARRGQNKLTFVISKRLASLGTWLEQLIAESTGKEGVGIVPIEGAGLNSAAVYGKDRYFVAIRLKNESWPKSVSGRAREMQAKGLSWADIVLPSTDSLGAEFLRWEIITSLASSVMGVNPFDEPNVKESKDITMKFLQELEAKGRISEPGRIYKVDSLVPFEDVLGSVKAGDYLAVLAYIDRSPETAVLLNRIRQQIEVQTQLPVCVGFGPRYLHSIGQLYKGGPKKGRFIVLIQDDKRDALIPSMKYGFSMLKRAQACGDLSALRQKGLSVLGIHLGKDTLKGLRNLESSLGGYFAKQTQ